MTASPSITVVIRCRNEAQHLGRLLRGLREQSVVPGEIVAVDSGSTDDTVALLEQHDVSVIHLEPGLFSFGRSLNVGIAATSSDLVVAASAHVYPLYDTWLELLTAPLVRPQVALSYGRQVGTEASKFSERRVFARWYPPDSIESQQDPFCNNANVAIRRRVWQDVPYDESLTGLEDLDWAKRVMARGHELAYCADAPVAHVHNETWAQIVNRYRREAIAHKTIYGDQRMHLVRALALAASNISSDYVYAARGRELARNLRGIPAFRVAQFWGTYRGFAQHGPVSRSLRERFYYPPDGARAHVSPLPAGGGSLIDYDETSRESSVTAP